MKRRSFIKKGAAGLTFLAVGAAGAGEKGAVKGEKRRLFGMPDSVRRRTPEERNLVRYSLARTDLPPVVWDEVVALGALARDVFDNPEVAKAFTRNPRRYLAAIGLAEITLDPKTVEVKAALALGDPAVHRALENDDPEDFLRALEDQGLLQNPDPSQLGPMLVRHMEQVDALTADGATTDVCSVTAACIVIAFAAIWVWVGLIQDVFAVVNIESYATVHTYVLLHAKAITPKFMVPESGLLRRQTPFLLASALGGEGFTDRALTLFIERNVERIAKAVEKLSIYRNRPPLPSPDLRTLIRGQLVRQLSGHAVRVPPVER